MSQLIETASSRGSPSAERLLLREFAHRISNEFASAISVISLAAARSANDEVKAALAAAQDRLQNYAQVHQALRVPEHDSLVDVSAYLNQLCGAISRSRLDLQGIELVLVERPLWMNSDCCWRLGMIVSELITNSARHAFRETGGVIRVELSSSPSFVQCRVTDNGTAATNIRRGHGLGIVEALAEGLDGKIDQQFGPRGVTTAVTFPVDHPCCAYRHAHL
jgi:two-component sensor histidine kinase